VNIQHLDIIVMQIVNVCLCRSERGVAYARGFASNPLILLGIDVEIVLMAAIAYTPQGQAVFGTAALPPSVWLFMLPFPAAMLVLETLRKAWVRRRRIADGVARAGAAHRV
jgi:hypothetical protein